MSELKKTGYALTNEQQVQAVLHFLPHSWEHMKVYLTYNTEIKTFDDVVITLNLKKTRWSLLDLRQKPMWLM